MHINTEHRGFTLAEVIMTLFIVGLVVTSAIPVFTTKKSTGELPAADKYWEPCLPDTRNAGLCAANGNKVVIGCDKIGCDETTNGSFFWKTNNIPDWTQKQNQNVMLYDLIDSKNKFFRVGQYYFNYINTNMIVTNSKIVFRGGEGTYKTPTHNVVLGTGYSTLNGVRDFNNNFILGNINAINDNVQVTTVIGNNNTIPANSHGAIIFGQNNRLNRVANGVGATIIGNNNVIDNNSIAIIGKPPTGTIDGSSLYIGEHIRATGPRVSPTLTFTNYDGVNINGALIVTEAHILSDERLKNIKGHYQKGLKEILQVHPIEFAYKADASQSKQVGVLAQELEKIFPEAVSKMPSGYLGVDSSPLFFAAINALKEVNAKTDEEIAKNKKLEEELVQLEAELKKLTSCRASSLLGKLECLKADLKRFIKSIIVSTESEVKNEKV